LDPSKVPRNCAFDYPERNAYPWEKPPYATRKSRNPLSQSNHLHLGANRVRRAATSCIRKAFSRSFERRSSTGIWGRPRRGRKRFWCVPFETRSIEFLFFGSATSPPVRANAVSQRRRNALKRGGMCRRDSPKHYLSDT
jgi:hypothetical protein